MQRLRLLWISDNPFVATGFARVSRELLSRLVKVPTLQVACLGWGYDGWPYDREMTPYRVYPGHPQSCGQDTFERVVEEFQPEVVVTLGEIWALHWMPQHPARNRVKWVAYTPLDGGPVYPPWEPLLRDVDELVAMSRFGQKVLQDGLQGRRIQMIPHGVDVSCFRPLSERAQLKDIPRLRGKCVIGCVARNQPRKNIPALIKAFAALSEGREDLHLYLHMNPVDVGCDVVTLLRRYRLQGKADVASPDFDVTRAVADSELNRLYNLCDITALPTNAEGFGLPILESLAAGVPVVATDHSACTELVGGRGELVRIHTTQTVGVNLIEHAVIDVDDLAGKLDKLTRDQALRIAYGKLGRAFAETLSWDRLVPQWLEVLQRVTGVPINDCGAGPE